eukprot:m.122426 g.122426  ORF g.122426 m.122426 type:complete len:227 (-) comp28918_c1_seq1:44-724(-)
MVTGLQADDKLIFKKFRKHLLQKIGARWVQDYDSSVTHILTGINEENNSVIRRTMKVMRGMAEGKWILGLEWAERCMEKGGLVAEDEFEACAIAEEIEDAPKRSRIAYAEGHRLFKGWSFYFGCDFEGVDNTELKLLLRSLGATVLTVMPTHQDTYVAVLLDSRPEDQDLEIERPAFPDTEADLYGVDFIFDSITGFEIKNPEDYDLRRVPDPDCASLPDSQAELF